MSDKSVVSDGLGYLFLRLVGMADSDNAEYDEISKLNLNVEADVKILCERFVKPSLDNQLPEHREAAKASAVYVRDSAAPFDLQEFFDRNLITVHAPDDIRRLFLLLVDECF